MPPLIFVVDDQGPMMIEMALMSHNIKVQLEPFKDPTLALEALKSKNPDLIFLDYKMPEMNGIDFLKCLKSMEVRIPVIMMSSVIPEKLRDYAIKHGAHDYLHKQDPNFPELVKTFVHKFATAA